MYVIYEILNIKNGKKYIGQTNNFYRRVKHHFLNSKNIIKIQNRRIYAGINKHGISNFIFKVIKTNLSKEQANYFEKIYIAEFNTMDKNFGYNMTSGGDSFVICEESNQKRKAKLKGKKKRKHTDEEKQQVSESLKNFYMKKNGKIKKDEELEFRKIRNKKALEVLNVSEERSIELLNGAFLNKNESTLWNSFIQKGKTISEETKIKIAYKASIQNREPFKTAIVEIDKNGNIINEWASMKELAQSENLRSSKISQVCRGFRKTTGKRIFRYKNGTGQYGHKI